jgi:hypothetical protein
MMERADRGELRTTHQRFDGAPTRPDFPSGAGSFEDVDTHGVRRVRCD